MYFVILWKDLTINCPNLESFIKLMQSNTSGGCGTLWFLVLSSILGMAVYLQLSFPHDLRDLWPQKFESHAARDISAQARNILKIDPVYFNKTSIGACEDVQIDSKGIAYCVNDRNEIVSIDFNQRTVQVIGKVPQGKSYGIRLSNDEKNLYIINTFLGLCEYNLETKEVTSLVSQFEGEFLLSLDAVQIHPVDSNILYITQASYRVPLDIYTIDILLNKPFGKLFQFNKKKQQISLVTDGLYFANGVVYQKYKNQDTVLVAETNRFRLTRVYLTGQRRGEKEIAVDGLDIYVDNIKANQKGQLWVGGPISRDKFLAFADRHPWIRFILSRLPNYLVDLVAQPKLFGGLKITFSDDCQKYHVRYYMWNCVRSFTFGTTVNQKNGNLYISSLKNPGIWYIPEFNLKIRRMESSQQKKNNQESEL